MTRAAVFQRAWTQAVKNKTSFHELIPKPVATGSNHRFITKGRGGQREETKAANFKQQRDNG